MVERSDKNQAANSANSKHLDEPEEMLDGTEVESPFYMSISENGLKTLTEEKILYTSKFHKIQWSCDPDYELPIKLSRELGPGSETPVTLSQTFLAQAVRLRQ